MSILYIFALIYHSLYKNYEDILRIKNEIPPKYEDIDINLPPPYIDFNSIYEH